MNNTWLNVLMTALAPAIWGSTYIVTTELLPPDRPFTAALLRAMPAGLLLVLYSRYWPARRDWPRLLVLAALNIGFFQALLFVAAYRLPGGLAAVVGAIQPLLMMGLVWSLDRQRPASAAVVASVVGIAGMAALLLAPGARWDLIGIVAAFVGTACMASGTYLTRRWQLSPPLLAFTGWQLLLGGLLLLPLAYWIDPPTHAQPTALVGLFLPVRVRRAAGVWPVVSRHCPPGTGGGVVAGLTQPLGGGVVGLVVTRSAPDRYRTAGLGGGAGQHPHCAMGQPCTGPRPHLNRQGAAPAGAAPSHVRNAG